MKTQDLLLLFFFLYLHPAALSLNRFDPRSDVPASSSMDLQGSRSPLPGSRKEGWDDLPPPQNGQWEHMEGRLGSRQDGAQVTPGVFCRHWKCKWKIGWGTFPFFSHGQSPWLDVQDQLSGLLIPATQSAPHTLRFCPNSITIPDQTKGCFLPTAQPDYAIVLFCTKGTHKN